MTLRFLLRHALAVTAAFVLFAAFSQDLAAQAGLRVVNVPEAGFAVAVYVGDSDVPLIDTLRPGEVSEVFNLPAGQTELHIFYLAGQPIVYDRTVNLPEGRRTTVLLQNVLVSDPFAAVTYTPPGSPGPGTTLVRVVHLDEEIGSLGVRIAHGLRDTTSFTPIPHRTFTPFANVAAGWVVALLRDDDADTIAGELISELPDGGRVTILVERALEPFGMSPVLGAAWYDEDRMDKQELTRFTARPDDLGTASIRFVNVRRSPVTPYVDDTLQPFFAGLLSFEATTLEPIELGDRSISLTTEGLPRLSFPLTAEPNMAYTVVAYGTAGELKRTVLTRDVLSDLADTADLVRFANLSTRFDSLRVRIVNYDEDTTFIGWLKEGEASTYVMPYPDGYVIIVDDGEKQIFRGYPRTSGSPYATTVVITDHERRDRLTLYQFTDNVPNIQPPVTELNEDREQALLRFANVASTLDAVDFLSFDELSNRGTLDYLEASPSTDDFDGGDSLFVRAVRTGQGLDASLADTGFVLEGGVYSMFLFGEQPGSDDYRFYGFEATDFVPSDLPFVRFINASPDAGTVRFRVNSDAGIETTDPLPYMTADGYFEIDGDVLIEVLTEGGSPMPIYIVEDRLPETRGEIPFFTLILTGKREHGTLGINVLDETYEGEPGIMPFLNGVTDVPRETPGVLLDLSIAPNPASSSARLALLVDRPGDYRASIYASNGELVRSFDVADNTVGGADAAIDCADLPDGAYRIAVTDRTTGTIVASRPFVVIHR